MIEKTTAIGKWVYYIFFISSFFGPVFFSYKVGSFSIFPARFFGLITCLLLLVILFTKGKKKVISLKLKYILSFFVLWFVYAIVTTAVSRDPVSGFRTIFNMSTGILLCLGALFMMDDKEAPRRLAYTWLLVYFVMIFIGLFENLTTFHLPISRFFENPALKHVNYKPTAVFVNENNFAAFLVMSFPLLLALFSHTHSIYKRILTATGFIIGVYLLFVTGSRISYIILFLEIIIFPFFLSTWGQRIKYFTIFSLTVLLIYFSMGIAQPMLKGGMEKEMASIGKVVSEIPSNKDSISGKEDIFTGNSINVRLNMIRNGLIYLYESHGLGIGTGNFETYIKEYQYYDTKGYTNPHNWWVELIVEQGVIITVGYLLFYFFLLQNLYKKIKQSKNENKWLPKALVMALIVFPLVAISPSRFISYSPQWLLLGLALSVASN